MTIEIEKNKQYNPIFSHILFKSCYTTKFFNRKQWNYVIVYKFDRFSRNKYETAMHKKTLKDNGVKVVWATEFVPDTPEGIIFESMLEGYKRSNGHNKNKIRIKAV